MSEPAFYQTRAGRTFYEKTLPDLVKQIRRLADAVERLTESFDRSGDSDGSSVDA